MQRQLDGHDFLLTRDRYARILKREAQGIYAPAPAGRHSFFAITRDNLIAKYIETGLQNYDAAQTLLEFRVRSRPR